MPAEIGQPFESLSTEDLVTAFTAGMASLNMHAKVMPGFEDLADCFSTALDIGNIAPTAEIYVQEIQVGGPDVELGSDNVSNAIASVITKEATEVARGGVYGGTSHLAAQQLNQRFEPTQLVSVITTEHVPSNTTTERFDSPVQDTLNARPIYEVSGGPCFIGKILKGKHVAELESKHLQIVKTN